MIAFPDSTSSPLDSVADVRRPPAALEDVRSFAERLAELPATAWLDVGYSLLRDPSSHASRATASAMLEAMIDERGLAVAAWYACDAIETSAFYVGGARTWTPADRRAFAAAHAAAEEAALAFLAREFVARDEYAALVAPFESVTREPFSAAQR